MDWAWGRDRLGSCVHLWSSAQSPKCVCVRVSTLSAVPKGVQCWVTNKKHNDRLRRGHRRKENTFFLLFEQGTLHCHFVLGLTSFVATTGSQ